MKTAKAQRRRENKFTIEATATATINLPNGPRYETIGYFDGETGKFVTIARKKFHMHLYFPPGWTLDECGEFMERRYTIAAGCSWMMFTGAKQAEVWIL